MLQCQEPQPAKEEEEEELGEKRGGSCRGHKADNCLKNTRFGVKILPADCSLRRGQCLAPHSGHSPPRCCSLRSPRR